MGVGEAVETQCYGIPPTSSLTQASAMNRRQCRVLSGALFLVGSAWIAWAVAVVRVEYLSYQIRAGGRPSPSN